MLKIFDEYVKKPLVKKSLNYLAKCLMRENETKNIKFSLVNKTTGSPIDWDTHVGLQVQIEDKENNEYCIETITSINTNKFEYTEEGVQQQLRKVVRSYFRTESEEE